MIRIEKVRKEYDNHAVALDNIDLTIEKESFVALLGPSGCGKTTTLNLLAGLLTPTSGNIYFGERNVTHLAPKDRNIGMVFQSYALYPHMKVIDNLAFPLKQKGMNKQLRYSKAEEIAKKVQIEHLLYRKPSQLSGGQQQRVALARALIKNPEVLLLDEPMSNLDTRLKIEVREEIKLIQRETGVTSIIVTHDQEEALAIADKIAILDNGLIQQYGTPAELYEKPANLFVAHYMGNPPMNFLEGILTKEAEIYSVCGKYFNYEVPQKFYGQLSGFIGKAVILGVRPQDFYVSHEKQGGIKAVVQLTENLERSILVKCSIGDDRIRVLFEKTELSHLLTDGYLNLSVRDDKINIFSKETGGNIFL